jgi:prephenate dehydratase
MALAFLGPRGTFSEEAALGYSEREGLDPDLVAFSSIPALTAAVETGLADMSILPIENSVEGSVSSTLDLLIHETPLRIRGEIVLPVRQFLVTVPGVQLDDVKVVTSHPQGLGQCRRFIERCLPHAEQVAALSTAGAVEEVAKSGDTTRAAIGPARAAELYGGSILAHDIQDNRANVTRFVVLAKEDAAVTGADKTSFAFTVKENVPGALHAILSVLADKGIQMTKIESRPTKAWLGAYVFLVDIDGHRADPEVAESLATIKQMSDVFQVFGSYPRFPLEIFAELFSSPGFPVSG